VRSANMIASASYALYSVQDCVRALETFFAGSRLKQLAV
jgi:hypothetical protein